jgi:hypothetical protein
MKITTSHQRNGKSKREKAKLVKTCIAIITDSAVIICYLSKSTTATAIDSPVAHAAVLDVDLNISRARGGTSKLMLLERGA